MSCSCLVLWAPVKSAEISKCSPAPCESQTWLSARLSDGCSGKKYLVAGVGDRQSRQLASSYFSSYFVGLSNSPVPTL